jgi:hypothetical protein
MGLQQNVQQQNEAAKAEILRAAEAFRRSANHRSEVSTALGAVHLRNKLVQINECALFQMCNLMSHHDGPRVPGCRPHTLERAHTSCNEAFSTESLQSRRI